MKTTTTLIFFFALLVTSLANAQSVVISNLTATRKLSNQTSEMPYTWSVALTCASPLDHSSVLVLAGSAKDKNDAGMTKATWHSANGQWQVLPATASYQNGQLVLTFEVNKSRLLLSKVFTVYVVDKGGAEVSNRLYVDMK
ncbi:MAG: hypothetical protein JWO58_453 [Chitinophagaceae bacterium]|nr:hypothetical protein [Chitinophagaceae bacterium]